jgi:hypothetical protein
MCTFLLHPWFHVSGYIVRKRLTSEQLTSGADDTSVLGAPADFMLIVAISVLDSWGYFSTSTCRAEEGDLRKSQANPRIRFAASS